MDIFTIVLAVASIVFAGVQFLDSRELKGKAESILASASTRYVAQFPDNMPEITRLIEGTCGELDIMADVPGYGSYSNPKAFLEYKEAILKVAARAADNASHTDTCVGKRAESTFLKRNGRPRVRLLLFAPPDRDSSLKTQFERTGFLKHVATADGRQQLQTFLDMNREPLRGQTVESYTADVLSGKAYEKLLTYIMEDQHRQESDFHNEGVEVRYARTPSNQLRVWIQDSAEAAFSFDHQPDSGDETEIAFRTHHDALVMTFKTIFEARWNDAVCFSDYWRATAENLDGGVRKLKSGCTGTE